jgi:hypothetical protein
MFFDCFRVNTGLGSHWICNSGKNEGYMWIDDVINLEPFFSFWPVGRGTTPSLRTDVTKNLKSIYGHDNPLVAVWLMVKEFPAPRRPNVFPSSLDSSHSAVSSAWWLKMEGMGVNKNISIFMLFDCVQINTGLGFHWICNSEKKVGYMWIDLKILNVWFKKDA